MISRKWKRKLQQLAEDPDVNLEGLSLSEESKQQIRLAYTLGKSGLHTGNNVTVFTNGKEKFETLIEDIKSQNIHHLQYYIFANDKLGNTIKQLLIDKSKEGVIVRVIYDDVGCWKVKQYFFDEMAAAGIKVRPFLRVTFPQLANKLNYRNHRKIIIIDGKIGYIGGMNIADRYNDGVSWGTWRDTHTALPDLPYTGLQTAFFNWLEFHDKRTSVWQYLFSAHVTYRKYKYTNSYQWPDRRMEKYFPLFLKSYNKRQTIHIYTKRLISYLPKVWWKPYK